MHTKAKRRKVDFVQTQPIICCRRMFWTSLLSYLTILDLDSARNPDHSKLVPLGYSITSAQTCLPVITTLTHSSGWSLISSDCSLSRLAEAYFVRLKLISSGWSVYPLTRNTSRASAGGDPAEPHIVADVCRDNSDNINNYETLLYEAHYCMVLLLQQCGLMLVNSCILKF